MRAACAKHGIAVTAYCPIARGRAGGDETLASVGKKYGKSPGQVSLRWLVQKGAIVIPRTSKVERLTENMSIFDFELSAQDMAEVDALAKPAGRRGQRRLGAELGLIHAVRRRCATRPAAWRRGGYCAAPRHARSKARPR